MRKLLRLGLVALLTLPTVAQAQSQRDVRQDQRDLREEQRDLNRAHRDGDRRDIRREQRDVRDARGDLRDSRFARDQRWGANDWRGYRNDNRNVYARGSWRAPFAYSNFRPGARIGQAYWGQRYFIADPWRYRLPQAARFQRWVRHYDDVLLVDTRRGFVVNVYRGFFW